LAPFLNSALWDVQTGVNALIPLIIIYGLPIFDVIALLAFAANAIMSMVRRDLGSILDSLCYTLIVLGFGEFAFLHAVPWMTAVQDTFVQLGQQLTGQSPNTLTPDGIMAQGVILGSYLFAAASKHGWLFISLAEVEALIAAVIIWMVFLCIALMLLLCELELTGCIVIGSILLIFSTIPWVLPSLQRYALSILSLGMKLIGLMVIVGLGMILAATWSAHLATTAPTVVQDIKSIMLPAMEAVLFGGLAYVIPNKIAGLVSGGSGPAMGLGEAALGAAASGGLAGARAGAQQASLAAIGGAASVAGTAAGTAARNVRNMLMSS
jgi:P-type conjugative transfer protein TrbL